MIHDLTKVITLHSLIYSLTLFLQFLGLRSQNFSSFVFAQQWGVNFCQINSCSNSQLLPSMFTIHGLWPQRGNSPVLYCFGPGTHGFKKSEILSIESQLDIDWPDLLYGLNTEFWEREWLKHGTCSVSRFSQRMYFQMNLNMYKNINIRTALESDGLVLNNTKMQSLSRVQKALFKKFGKEQNLRCRLSITHPRKSLLVEVFTCFDVDGVTLIDCDPSKTTCPAKFTI